MRFDKFRFLSGEWLNGGSGFVSRKKIYNGGSEMSLGADRVSNRGALHEMFGTVVQIADRIASSYNIAILNWLGETNQ